MLYLGPKYSIWLYITFDSSDVTLRFTTIPGCMQSTEILTISAKVAQANSRVHQSSRLKLVVTPHVIQDNKIEFWSRNGYGTGHWSASKHEKMHFSFKIGSRKPPGGPKCQDIGFPDRYWFIPPWPTRERLFSETPTVALLNFSGLKCGPVSRESPQVST